MYLLSMQGKSQICMQCLCGSGKSSNVDYNVLYLVCVIEQFFIASSYFTHLSYLEKCKIITNISINNY